MTFAARFSGRCEDCRETFDVGQLIQYDADSRLVHDECDPDFPRLEMRRNEVVCQECWLIQPCECEPTS